MENVVEKLKNLSLPEKLISGGGLLMFIAGFFPWWHLSLGSFGSASQDGWSAPGSIWSLLAILISLALMAVVLVQNLTDVKMPDLPQGVTWGTVFGGGAGLVVVLMLLKFWRIEAVPAGGMGWGFFVAIVAAIAIAAGGAMTYMEEKKGAGTQRT